MVPLPIAEGMLQTLSPEVAQVTAALTHYFVEDLRTARRFLKSLHPTLVIDTLLLSEIEKHTGPDLSLFRKWIKEGKDIGIMSESGCPGIADPGSVLVNVAHEMNVKVKPLTGPNSIILALMASGLNGQNFAFNGYLPIKEPQRSKRMKEYELHSAKEKQTQVFIETPFRNNHLLTELLKNCLPYTRLCIAQNVTAEGAFIKTKTVNEWKKNVPALEKLPTVFLLLA